MYYKDDPAMTCGDDYLDDIDLRVDMTEFMAKFPLPRCKFCREQNLSVRPVELRRKMASMMARRREDLANKLWIEKCNNDLEAAQLDPNSPP